MKTTEYIASTIGRLSKGYIFTCTNFIDEVNKKEAVVKALNRMTVSGTIAKLAKGKYYKPESTPFGKLQPDQSQIVKDLLNERGAVTGYLTGISIYNKLGLTTQVGSIIEIGKNDVRPTFKRLYYTIAFVKQKNAIKKEYISLLQILDCIRYIKKIPDTTIEQSCNRLLSIIGNLPDKDKSTLVKLAIKYPSASRALLGALLDELKEPVLAELLYQTLNPLTKYKLAGAGKVLSTAAKWRIT